MAVEHTGPRPRHVLAVPAGTAGLWLWLDLTAPAVLLAGDVQFGVSSLNVLTGTWIAFLALRLLLETRQRPITVFWLAFTLYSVSAWVAAVHFNERFPPFPNVDIISSATATSLEVLFVGFIALRLLTLVFPFASWWRRQMDGVGALAREMSRGRYAIACLLLLAIAAIDWYKLVSLGLGNVLTGQRRQFASELLSASNHNVWVLALAATIALGLHAITSGARSRSSTLAYGILAIYWLPSVLVGSRQVLVAAGVSIMIVAIAGHVLSPGAATRAKIVAGVLLVALFLLPLAETGKINQSTIEFVYPQYMLFSAMAFTLPLHMSYLEGLAFMLPSGLRPTHVEIIGDQFKALNLTNVGVGDHPIGEAYIDSPHHVVLVAVAATLVVVVLVAVLSRLSPAFLVVGAGQLVVWGRSDFWVVVFYVVYGGALLALLLRAPSETQPHPP